MSIHYNAFISYRHHPDDIRVASEIHRSLERFHVPRKIRQKYGKINRLFRDKEELPITSDLNDDIDEALKNSDYLIVICSIHTKESIWVQREIELFLKTHHRSKVLTVLASGEPYDVIPEILLHDTVIDEETGLSHQIDIEPLSCDWRGKRRKAVQEELPRLAAPLLGCSYDELRQRQKQYQTRRNTAIIASALAASFSLTAYFLYTSITIQQANTRIQQQNEEIRQQNDEIQAANIQIQANLDTALINQSRHLATAAQERLTEGDRLTAIALAAAALPAQDNPRPYVPEAEQILSEALGVYSTSSQIEAIGTITPEANVLLKNFCVSDSEETIYLYDKRNVITSWNTNTLQKLGGITLSDTADDMFTTKDDNLVVHNGLGIYTVACYEPDGTLLWQMDHCPNVTYLRERNEILLIHETGKGAYELLSVDVNTGEPLRASLDLTVEDPSLDATTFVSTPVSDVVLIRYYQSFGNPMPYYSVNLNTGEIQLVDLPVFPTKSLITEDGSFICMGEEEGLGISAVVEGNRVTTPGTKRVYCFNLHTGTLMWENAITPSSGALTSKICVIPNSNHILLACGNLFMVVDSQTGETIAQCGTGSVIEAVQAGEKYATAVLQDGYIGYYYYDNNYCYEIKCMKNGVSSAEVGNNCYSLHWQEDHVTVYQNIAAAPAWESLLANAFSVNKQAVHNQYLAFQDSSNQYLFDMETTEFLYVFEKGQKDVIGFSTDGKKLWYAEDLTAVTELDIATGSMQTHKIELKTGESISLDQNFGFFENCLYYTIRNGQQLQLVRWDLNTFEKTSCVLQADTQEDIARCYWTIIHVQDQYVWLHGYGKMLLEADMQTGKTQIILEETSHRPVIAWHPEKHIVAIGHEDTIRLKNPGDESMSTITLDNAKVGSMYFWQDSLLALCDNEFFYRFDLEGNLLNQTELWVSSQFGSDLLYSYTDFSKLSWTQIGTNNLVINALGEGNVIDCETWAVKATVSNYICYDVNSNCFVCKAGNAVAGYTYYDTAALLEQACEELMGFQMTQEQKNAYGID